MTHLARQLAALGLRVRSAQDSRLESEHSLGLVRAHVLSAERRVHAGRSLIRRRGLMAVSFAAVVGLACLALAPRLLHHAPLAVTADDQALRVGDWIQARDAALLAFSDGTNITLDPGTRARLEAVDAAGAHLAIETGHADVNIVPGRGGRWHFSLGPFGVDVTGAEFEIAWNPEDEALSLAMREGKITVSGCELGEGRPLVAGERLVASCLERRFEVGRMQADPAPEPTPPNKESAHQPEPKPAAARP